jgi:hypothetical protein
MDVKDGVLEKSFSEVLGKGARPMKIKALSFHRRSIQPRKGIVFGLDKIVVLLKFKKDSSLAGFKL